MAKPKKGVVPPQLRPYLFKGKGGSRRGGSRAGSRGPRRQGLVSWATSVVALGIGLSNVFARAGEAYKAAKGTRLQWFGKLMIKDYTGFDVDTNSWSWKNMIRGYAPIAGGVAFKKGTSYLVKTAKVQSLIPNIGLGTRM